MFIIKLKGIKKQFSSSPIDYVSIRKSDVIKPKRFLFKSKFEKQFTCLKTTVTKLETSNNSLKLIIYIHGGAFVSGPVKHHWDSISKLYKSTNHTIWMVNYPKAPESNIEEIAQNIDAIYEKALTEFNPENITIIGDSVGGTLALTLTQRLIDSNKNTPSQLILISPVVDASFENLEINNLDEKDPILGKKGVLSAKKLVAGDNNLKSSIISPLFGSFTNFPTTHLFIAENDITYPDQKLLINKLKKNGIAGSVIIGQSMPHIWPLLPVVEESKIALNQIIALIK